MFFANFRAKPPRPAELWQFHPQPDITAAELARILAFTALNQYIRFEPGNTPADQTLDPGITRHFARAPDPQ